MSPEDPRHGTTRGYHGGCREACCKRAMARYEKACRLDRLRGGRAVPALGAQRRLQALMRLGWSSHAIAAAAGLRHRNHVWRIINGQKGKPTVWIQRDTDQWVREVYERLSMTVPQGGYSNRTRAHAERKGWPPPLCWDDPDTDPEPRGIRDRERRDLHTEWAELQEAGESIEQAARRLGVTVGAIEKAAERRKKETAA
jgi:hypothetical protein